MANADYQVEYRIAGAMMDASVHPDNLPDNTMSRMVGVDGRYRGSARRYPGNVHVMTLTGPSSGKITFCRHVAMTVDGVEHRGFLYQYNSNALRLELEEEDGSGTTQTLTATGPADSKSLDVCSRHEYLYVFRKSAGPVVLYEDSGIEEEPMGPVDDTFGEMKTGDMAEATAGAETGDTADHFLSHRGRYMFAYKYYHTKRQIYTGLSESLTHTMSISDSSDGCKVVINIPDAPSDADWDMMEVYRSMNLRDPLDPYHTGDLFLEQTIAKAGQATMGLLSDAALVQQKRYDPWADPLIMPPNSGACAYYEGSVFAAQDPDTNGGVGLVWTNPYKTNTEEFGSEYSYPGLPGDGPVQRFIRAGDDLYAFTNTAGYLIRKAGGEVAISRMQDGRGLLSKEAICAIDREVVMLTQQGLMILGAGGGARQLVQGFNRIFHKEWSAYTDNISMGYDSKMGCVFILNADLGQCACLWDSTQSITMLYDFPFEVVTSGPDVEFNEGGGVRAYFVRGDGVVATPDYNQDKDGGICPTANASYATFSVADGVSDLATLAPSGGRVVRVVSGSDRGTTYVNDTPTPTWQGSNSAGDIIPAAGSIIACNALYMQLRFSPVRPEMDVHHLFHRKVIKAVAIKCTRWTRLRIASDMPEYLTFGMFRDKTGDTVYGSAADSTNDMEGEVQIDITTNPSTCCKAVKLDGFTLEPNIECVVGPYDIELTGLLITGTITLSEKAS